MCTIRIHFQEIKYWLGDGKSHTHMMLPAYFHVRRGSNLIFFSQFLEKEK